MADLIGINSFLQERLTNEGLPEVKAVDAAQWLDTAGLLNDSRTRRGKPLRDLLRAGLIEGAYQESGRLWWIRRIQRDSVIATQAASPTPTQFDSSDSEQEFGAIVTVNDARAAGFTGFLTVGECIRNGLPRDPALNECGVYLVYDSSGSEPVFIPPEEARETGNVIRPWPVSRLEGKWVDAAEILYIGLAGARSSRALRKRLQDLCRHASGHTTDRGPHRGGEIL